MKKQKINISLPASIMTDDKTKDYVNRNARGQVESFMGAHNRCMRSHKSGNIRGENFHIWAVEPKKSFLEN